MDTSGSVSTAARQLAQALLDGLQLNESVNKYELLQFLHSQGVDGISVRDVNKILYYLEKAGSVRRSTDSLPKWSWSGTVGYLPEADGVEAEPMPTFTAGKEAPPLRQWQREALDAWKRAKCCGVVQAVTGTGKTRVGIEAAKAEIGEGGVVLILVPSLTLLRQWYDLLTPVFGEDAIGMRGDGYSDDFRESSVIVSTPQSALSGLHFSGKGLLIADECHRYGAESWGRALNPRFKKRLGLSATFERGDEGDKRLVTYFGGPPVFNIEYDRAIREGIVCPFLLAFVGVNLGEMEMSRYREHEEACGKARGKLIDVHGLPKEPFAEFMRAVVAASKFGGEGRVQRTAWRYLSNFTKKRDILADSSAKLARLDSLDAAVAASNGTLVFTQTKAAALSATAQFVNRGHSAAAIFGELRSDDREQILESFREGDIAIVAAPRVLDEGVDVPDADLAIVVSASSGRRQMIQRMGRVLRLKDGKLAKFVILYAVGTSEDPALGAHEGFTSIAGVVARASEIFGPEASPSEICRFLAGADSAPVC